MTARLVVQAPGGQRHDFPLDRPAIVIGRSQECDLVLDYPYISRRHTRIERNRDEYTVIDSGSTNGTHVNGRRVNEMQVLSTGDEIALGEITITFFDSAVGEATTTFFRPIAADSPIRCDSSSWQVWIGESLLETKLSLQEFELLSLLTSRYGKVSTRDELGTAIWGRGNYDYNMLHRLVHRLKEKLGAEYGALIVSVPGRGYKASLAVPEAAAIEAPEPTPFRTVLFTDVEGSTALTQRFGDLAARELLREHEQITRGALKAHGGSEVKTMGDGFMASFASTARAVQCAVSMQRAFAERNESAEVQIDVRIGLNAGEPIAEQEDLFGTPVIVASRLAAEAKGGQILVSDVVRQLIAGKGFQIADCGEVEMKGFDSPLHAYEVRWQEQG